MPHNRNKPLEYGLDNAVPLRPGSTAQPDINATNSQSTERMTKMSSTTICRVLASYKVLTKYKALASLFIVSAALAGCDSSRDPVLGFDGVNPVLPPPILTSVVPPDQATGVALNTASITASFSEPVQPFTGNASFAVTCEAPCVDPVGTVTLSDDARTVIFAPTANLAALTTYTATITGATSVATGGSLLSPYIWQFTTGSTSDTTRPRVTLTAPATTTPGPTANVPTNAAVSATFSEAMAALTLNDASFTLTCEAPCVSPAGSVRYASGSRTAIFSPAAALEEDTTYTATITSDATDLALNALAGNQAALPSASDYVWTFTTATAVAAAEISVLSTQPDDGALACTFAAINATFTVPSGLRMDPNTVNATTFSVRGTSGLIPASSVALDNATGTVATFTPLQELTAGRTYTATITGGPNGVKDLAIPGNELADDVEWTFTTDAAINCLQPISLNSAQPYGVFGGSAGMTNTGIQTVIDGDIGSISTATSTVTGFHDSDADVYTETLANIGAVNGLIYTCTNSTTGPTAAAPNAVYCDIATEARLDAEAAYLEMAGLPGGPDPGAGNLANLVLAPGVYTATGGSFMIEGGNLTLDAQGDANATWVFQMATTLTVGGPGVAAPQSIILVNGALARNVFWQVGSAATINAAGGGTMAGTIIAQAGVAFSTVGNTDITTLNGRALSLGASVTLVDTVINVPSP